MSRLLLALVVLLALAGDAAARKAQERYYLELQSVTATDAAPAEVSVKARALLVELLAGRPEVVADLPGAPDPERAPRDFQRYLVRHHLRAFKVDVKIDRYRRALAEGGAGLSGRTLTIDLGVSLVGTTMPSGALALSGSGQSTVTAQVGARLLPGEEESARDDALRDALTHAVDDAITRLRLPPPGARKKRHHR